MVQNVGNQAIATRMCFFLLGTEETLVVVEIEYKEET